MKSFVAMIACGENVVVGIVVTIVAVVVVCVILLACFVAKEALRM
jgi:hypothetical protein